MAEKHIEVCKMRAGDLKTEFGNPRKITQKKLKELEESLKTHGDFGIFLIDENNNVIAGNQRLKAVINLYGEDRELDCKRLVGYTERELRTINVKDNTHSGEWDLNLLADWSADSPSFDGIVDMKTKPKEDRRILEMELVPFEKYDYVMLVCKSSLDYDELVAKLGIAGKVCHVTATRTIRARAIWYNEFRNVLWGNDKKAQVEEMPESEEPMEEDEPEDEE